MRVIEQLVQHFWARGAISRAEAMYLVKHGFVRDADLPGLIGNEREIDPATYQPRPGDYDEAADRPDPADDAARRAEELEADLVGRGTGTKKSGKKKKPSGHNLAPAAARLATHYAAREAYPALVELGSRLKTCATWRDAAVAVGDASPAKLGTALVGLLNARPRALGELWFWFDLDPLFDWVENTANEGPVAEGLGKLMRAANRNEVGRLGQLMKCLEVRDLGELLEARRNFLGQLPYLYEKHFARLRHWLVPPAGEAATTWPALPWTFVLVYNVRHNIPDQPPPGYDVSWYELELRLREAAFTTALGIERVGVLGLLAERALSVPIRYGQSDFFRVQVFRCPLHWRV